MKKILTVLLAVLCAGLCACAQTPPAETTQIDTLPTLQTVQTEHEASAALTVHIVESVAKNGGRRQNNTATFDCAAEPAQDVHFQGKMSAALVFDVTEVTAEGVQITLKDGAYVYDSSTQLQDKSAVKLTLVPGETVQAALETDDAGGIYTFTLTDTE